MNAQMYLIAAAIGIGLFISGGLFGYHYKSISVQAEQAKIEAAAIDKFKKSQAYNDAVNAAYVAGKSISDNQLKDTQKKLEALHAKNPAIDRPLTGDELQILNQ